MYVTLSVTRVYYRITRSRLCPVMHSDVRWFILIPSEHIRPKISYNVKCTLCIVNTERGCCGFGIMLLYLVTMRLISTILCVLSVVNFLLFIGLKIFQVEKMLFTSEKFHCISLLKNLSEKLLVLCCEKSTPKIAKKQHTVVTIRAEPFAHINRKASFTLSYMNSRLHQLDHFFLLFLFSFWSLQILEVKFRVHLFR